jgi:hypothetical protein
MVEGIPSARLFSSISRRTPAYLAFDEENPPKIDARITGTDPAGAF